MSGARRSITEEMAGLLINEGLKRGVKERPHVLLQKTPVGGISGDVFGLIIVGRHGREHGVRLAEGLSLPGHLATVARYVDMSCMLATEIYAEYYANGKTAQQIAQKLQKQKQGRAEEGEEGASF